MKAVIQNSAIKDYLEFHYRPYKALEILLLSAPIFLLTRVVLQYSYIRLKVHCRVERRYINGKNFFAERDLTFLVFSPYHKLLPCQVWYP